MNRTTGSSAGAALYRRYWAARNSHRNMAVLVAESKATIDAHRAALADAEMAPAA
jgi:hypothetical protein